MDSHNHTCILMEKAMTTDTITDDGLYRLMAWLSPAYPVGAYAYSHGLEYAVEAGMVHDEDSLARWVEGIIAFGAGRMDGAFFAQTWRAATANDDVALAEVTERAAATRGTAELALESSQQGEAFLKTLRASAPSDQLARFANAVPMHAYPTAVAMAAAICGIALRPALLAYIQAAAANLISAGVRLVPLGQYAGQRIVDRLRPTVLATAIAALNQSPNRTGSAAAVVDWTSMKHETQYTRLFRS
jgi:urease accessory protein